MKTSIYSIMTVCILKLSTFSGAYGQHIIEYDFKYGRNDNQNEVFQIPAMVKGDFYKLKITNINTNLYKVLVNARDTVTAKALSTPTFADLSLDALKSAVAGIGPLSTAVSLALESTQKSVTKMNFELLAMDFTGVSKAAGTGKVEEVKKELERVKQSLDEQIKNLETIVGQIDGLKLEVYKTRLLYLRTSGAATSFGYDEALRQVERIRSSLTTLGGQVAASKATYEAFAKANATIIEQHLKEANNAIKTAYGEFETTIGKAKGVVSADATHTLLNAIVLLENNQGNSYVTLPMQFTGDRTDMEITIAPRADSLLGQTYKTRLSFPLHKKEYAGVGLSFYYSSLKSEAYSYIETADTDSTSHFNIVQEDESAGEIGVASLFRFGTKAKNSDRFGIHASFGPGFSISDKVRPRVLYGVGVTIGKVHSLAIDLGGSTGYVDKKSNAVDLSRDYSAKPESATVASLSTGIFISAGYLFTF